MTKDQAESLKKYNAAPFRCAETCGRHFSDVVDYESHVLSCRHIFPAVRAALQRQKDRGLPVAHVSKPIGLAAQPDLFLTPKTHRKRR